MLERTSTHFAQCSLCTILIGGEYVAYDAASHQLVIRRHLEQRAYVWRGATVCEGCMKQIKRHPEFVTSYLIEIELNGVHKGGLDHEDRGTTKPVEAQVSDG